MKILAIIVSVLFLSLVGCSSPSAAGTSSSTNSAQSPTAAADTSTEPKEMSYPVNKTDADWKKELSPEEYAVLRLKGTERPFTGKYDDFFQPGTYTCPACGQVLFTSDTKFNSGCGWPAFYAAAAGDKVKLIHDGTLGMERVEVLCAHCGSHLGHVFDDAPQTPTGQRYCINSVSIKFTPKTATTKP